MIVEHKQRLHKNVWLQHKKEQLAFVRTRKEDIAYLISARMSDTSAKKLDFFPVATIVAFAFIGAMIFIGVIARCLASNHSTMRSTQNSDLMIYQAAPKPAPVPRPRRPSTENRLDVNGHAHDPTGLSDDSKGLVPVQRGPKHLWVHRYNWASGMASNTSLFLLHLIVKRKTQISRGKTSILSLVDDDSSETAVTHSTCASYDYHYYWW